MNKTLNSLYQLRHLLADYVMGLITVFFTAFSIIILRFSLKYNYEFESGLGIVYKVENDEVIIVQYA